MAPVLRPLRRLLTGTAAFVANAPAPVVVVKVVVATVVLVEAAEGIAPAAAVDKLDDILDAKLDWIDDC